MKTKYFKMENKKEVKKIYKSFDEKKKIYDDRLQSIKEKLIGKHVKGVVMELGSESDHVWFTEEVYGVKCLMFSGMDAVGDDDAYYRYNFKKNFKISKELIPAIEIAIADRSFVGDIIVDIYGCDESIECIDKSSDLLSSHKTYVDFANRECDIVLMKVPVDDDTDYRVKGFKELYHCEYMKSLDECEEKFNA